jgi:glycosyltransferase involved in cell wall biosynthesis
VTGVARSRPRVTACMPAWNAAAFIRPVLASLTAQTYPDLDLLISVDACSDDTADICAEFAAANPRVRVIRQPSRLGWIGNANALLEAASGDYLFFAFHDDPLRPQYVERLVEALERNPDAVLAFCDVDSNIGAFSYDVLDGIGDRFARARRVLLQQGPWWVPNRGLMRGGAVKALGGMRRHRAGEVAADLPWLLRLALAGPFVRVPLPLIVKAFRDASLSASWQKDTRRRLAVVLACLDVIRAAGFGRARTLRLYCEAAVFCARSEFWYLRHAPSVGRGNRRGSERSGGAV